MDFGFVRWIVLFLDFVVECFDYNFAGNFVGSFEAVCILD